MGDLDWLELDPGIRETVRVLRENGIETSESCEGTVGHSFTEPTVCFYGDNAEGYRAVAVAMQYGLRPARLYRTWEIKDGELVGPEWRMTFFHPNGGGIHPIERGDGLFDWQWGAGSPHHGHAGAPVSH